MPPPIVKQPHYVWRHYLEAWEVSGNLHVLREGRCFSSPAKNVAKEGGFHNLPDLSDDDVKFLIAISVRAGSPQEQQHREFIDRIVAAQRISAAVIANPAQHGDTAVAWAQKVLRDTEEELVSAVECLAVPWLAALRERDCSFLQEPKNNLFFYFIAMQYLRTKAIARSIAATAKVGAVDQFAVQLARVWPVMRQIHSVNVAASLFSMKSSYGLIFLDNECDVDFIVGDQPIVNIHAVTRGGKAPEEFELFYPLTPRRAMVWSKQMPGQYGVRIRANEQMIEHHNGMMAAVAHEMIFATSKAALEPYASNGSLTHSAV